MILGLWLDQPVWLMFALLAVPFLGLCAILSVLTLWRRSRPLMQACGTGIVAPYFSAISVLLALLTGFVANDAWERQRQASRVVQSERANARAVYDLSIATVSDMSGIRASLANYLDAVIGDEWPAMAETGHASQRAGAALGRLLQAVADPKAGAESGPAAQSALLDAVMNLRSARGERLALADAQGDETKWLTLLVLAALTLVALALIHLEKPRAQATVLLLFAAAMISTLGLIALHERPFDGPMALKPDALRAARAGMEIKAP
ncbi:DUF4239 domain-containing protein [Methylobacterium brachythecii]|uniref:DUF4239 domain-containing protein n=1 Tax=Methylobacterium brachythecii TaxID=1176177 RepID=A0A7W6F7T0_9HYPH|nr:DUF4239 domain-containing protein [Methylobacterium brachythecii]MBB3903772.1 hypothetical protein [Methylobacterium brachythecii]GLS44856.1 hypothetical protein GCM10007884_28450 [Methylobacterium brachythecii]